MTKASALPNIQTLSLPEKIGQMFICGFDGYTVSEHVRELIERCHIGGVVYFRRNIESVEQICKLSAQLQSMSKVPLLTSIDQEGGMVARIEKDVTLMPGNMAMAAAGNVEAVYESALITGHELRMMGINMNFAPCVDVNNNPLNPVIGVRSFGELAESVARMGKAAVQGYQGARVVATVKHFPGHGDVDVDSHRGLPLMPFDRKRMQEVELVPFKEAIRAGVDAIMTAHVIFPAYDPELIPSTISRPILTGLLREELQFDGIIVTDCLEMDAIKDSVGIAEGAVRAVKAGADMVLISHLLERQKAGIHAVLRAVEWGEIPMEQIDASVKRILKLKQKRRLAEIPRVACTELKNRIGSPTSREVARRISERSITLVKDEDQLPLDVARKTLVIWPEVRVGSEVDEVIEQEITLGRALADYLPEVHEEAIGTVPTDAEIAHVLRISREYGQIVIGTYNASASPGQVYLVKKLAQREGVRLVVAALRNPFDLNAFPEIGTYLASYENKPLSLRSLAKVLMGKITPVGRLPVHVAGYPSGWLHPQKV